MIDIAMTAAVRPDIIEQTLRSLFTNIEYKPMRLVVDIAPVGEVGKYTQEYCKEVIKDVCNQFDIQLTCRILATSWQAEALKWTWKDSFTEFMLQWEDDWLLLDKINLNTVMKLMFEYSLSMLYFDRFNKSVIDYPNYQGRFDKVNDYLYIRKMGKSLGGPPALLIKEYVQKVIPLIKDDICLDTMSHDKNVKELLDICNIGVYLGESKKGNLVKDIGKLWKRENRIIMKKGTKQGVQWIKKS